MKDYRAYSFWLDTCDDDLTPRPPLDGSVDVDVAILGAGFTGLWTAYELLSRDPSLKVAIVEKEIAGFGASGRNGGWCFAGFPIGPLVLLL
jgi:glycine/D-amino acid oxidase-like deaminating enzyme